MVVFYELTNMLREKFQDGLHGVSPYFWALNLPPLVGLTGSSAWVLHSFPAHSFCNQPKGVIFTAEIETCESSSLFPQEMKVQLGLDESPCRSREG